jgi:hypothetical protein
VLSRDHPNLEIVYLLVGAYPEGLFDPDYDDHLPYDKYVAVLLQSACPYNFWLCASCAACLKWVPTRCCVLIAVLVLVLTLKYGSCLFTG